MSTIQTAAPVIPFRESRTCRSLQEALREKLHARQSYLDAAQALENNGLFVVAHAFRFTAAQENEHAAILQGLLLTHGRDILSQEENASLPRDPLEMLRAAAAAEHAVWDERCPLYVQSAEQEGYLRIAAALRRIAETDQLHARRFVQYMEVFASGSLLKETQPVSWVCLRCGQLHTGCEPPALCPGCSGGQGHFIRTSFHPFSVEG